MKLLIILLSFSSFGQDTIPCDKSRFEIKKEYALKELTIKLFDDQHKRDNTKEIKSFRFQLRTFKAANNTLVKQIKSTERMYNDRLDFVSDSLNRMYKLDKRKTKDSTDLALKIADNAFKTQKKELNKQINSNTLVWWGGLVISLGLVLGIVWMVKR